MFGNEKYAHLPGPWEPTLTQRGVTPLKPQWFHILLALSDGEKHGSGIMRVVLEQSNAAVKLWPATLYGALEQLTDAGLIAELSGSGHHPKGQSERKKYYRLSRAGRAALEVEDIQTLMNKGLGEALNPNAVDFSGKLISTWAALRK